MIEGIWIYPLFRERYVVQELCKVGSEADIQSFEYIRGVLLEPILFSVDNGLLTGKKNTFLN